jgi:hypothetical protein
MSIRSRWVKFVPVVIPPVEAGVIVAESNADAAAIAIGAIGETP